MFMPMIYCLISRSRFGEKGNNNKIRPSDFEDENTCRKNVFITLRVFPEILWQIIRVLVSSPGLRH